MAVGQVPVLFHPLAEFEIVLHLAPALSVLVGFYRVYDPFLGSMSSRVNHVLDQSLDGYWLSCQLICLLVHSVIEPAHLIDTIPLETGL